MDPLLLELKSTDMEQSEDEKFSDLLNYVFHGPAAARGNQRRCRAMKGR
jgi:hypothetical protein